MTEFRFKLPDVGEGIAEAEIVAWHVKPGDEVREDDPFVDVMTDKATVEIPSPATGRVVSLTGEAGETVPVGEVIAVLETGAEQTAAPAPALAEAHATDQEAAPEAQAVPAEKASDLPAELARHALASPAVRLRAEQLGVSLDAVSGSGPEGRISHADLDAHLAGRARLAPAGPRDGVEVVKVVGLRRAIATRMAESKRRIPHYSYIEEIDVTELERLRSVLNTSYPDRPRLSVLPFIARALVRVLVDYPEVNARFDDEAGEIQRHAAVHLGVATQTPTGLMVPVLRHAEALDLWRTADAVRRLAEDARAGKSSREDLTGSTITITSLGALGGIATTPVINAPEVAIIGPNRIVERPVVVEGEIVVRKMMNLSSSFDHRVVDGWDAARFIQAMKAMLETPALIFVEQP